jgi:DNA helicase HerA-like ATPase
MKDDTGSAILAVVAVVVLVPLIFAGLFIVAVPLGIGWAAYYWYTNDRGRQERQAQKQCWAIYEATRAASLPDFEAKLSTYIDWLPEPMQSSLIGIGVRLWEFEGFPTAIAPPPPVCNSIAGAQYQDRLTRLTAINTDEVLKHISLMIASPVANRGLNRIAVEEMVSIAEVGVLKETKRAVQVALEEQKKVRPADYKKDDLTVYLRGTPLTALASFTYDFPVPLIDELRIEHHHIVAGSGHGKTQCLQSMILDDLKDDVGIIVIDSQRELIQNLLHVVPPERLVHIDPTDKEWPLAVNLFDGSQDVDLYEYIFAALDAEMTSKQATVYRYMARLLSVIPNATIHTMRKLLEPDGFNQYRDYVAELPETARSFFENEFGNPKNKQFTETKQQILRRLYTVLENDTFANMFSSPVTKIDIGAEMADGKVILIDTAKGVLGSGFALFGRFWIAQIARAVFQKRAGKTTYLYIDEAQEYFSDENILVELFTQARKFNVGLIVVHQFLGQLPPKVAQAISANTAIKFAGGVSAADRRALASEMKCEPEYIDRQPKGTFAAYYRGHPLSTYSVELGRLEKMPKRSTVELEAIRDTMRAKYRVKLETPASVAPTASQSVPEDVGHVEEAGEWE